MIFTLQRKSVTSWEIPKSRLSLQACFPLHLHMHCPTDFPSTTPSHPSYGHCLGLLTKWTGIISYAWKQIIHLSYSGCELGVHVLGQVLVWRPSIKFCSLGVSIPHYKIRILSYSLLSLLARGTWHPEKLWSKLSIKFRWRVTGKYKMTFSSPLHQTSCNKNTADTDFSYCYAVSALQIRTHGLRFAHPYSQRSIVKAEAICLSLPHRSQWRRQRDPLWPLMALLQGLLLSLPQVASLLIEPQLLS